MVRPRQNWRDPTLTPSYLLNLFTFIHQRNVTHLCWLGPGGVICVNIILQHEYLYREDPYWISCCRSTSQSYQCPSRRPTSLSRGWAGQSQGSAVWILCKCEDKRLGFWSSRYLSSYSNNFSWWTSLHCNHWGYLKSSQRLFHPRYCLIWLVWSRLWKFSHQKQNTPH